MHCPQPLGLAPPAAQTGQPHRVFGQIMNLQQSHQKVTIQSFESEVKKFKAVTQGFGRHGSRSNFSWDFEGVIS